jgi:hypothetical protein
MASRVQCDVTPSPARIRYAREARDWSHDVACLPAYDATDMTAEHRLQNAHVVQAGGRYAQSHWLATRI